MKYEKIKECYSQWNWCLQLLCLKISGEKLLTFILIRFYFNKNLESSRVKINKETKTEQPTIKLSKNEKENDCSI